MNFSKTKIVLVLIILFFVMIIGMFFMKPKNAYEGFSDEQDTHVAPVEQDASSVEQDTPSVEQDASQTLPEPTNSIKKSNKG